MNKAMTFEKLNIISTFREALFQWLYGLVLYLRAFSDSWLSGTTNIYTHSSMC